MIHYGKQSITAADIDAVAEVLQSDFLTQGPKIVEFESAICGVTKAKFSVALSNGTAALHAACKALGVKQGDVVWTSPISFAASANCALYCNADVDFVDVDEQTGLFDLTDLEEKLLIAKQNDALPKVVIPVHYAGQSVDMKRLGKLAQTFGFSVIEDACHAFGGSFDGAPVGDCRYSDITIFSFHPVKNLTTGEGGVATTNCPLLNEKLNLFRSHGITKDPSLMSKADVEPWYYEQVDLGFNYRLTDIQAALGLSQITRLKEFVSKRKMIVERYQRELAPVKGVDVIRFDDNQQPAWHLCPILLENEEQRRWVYDYLLRHDIRCQVHYLPIYWLPYYQKLGFQLGKCPKAESFYRRVLSVPVFYELSDEMQTTVIQRIKEALS